MATNLYRMKTGSSATAQGRALQDALAALRAAYSAVQEHFEAMTQEKDDTTDFSTMAIVYGFVDDANAINEPTAEAAYGEINSFIGNGGPSLTQLCARMKQ